MSRNLWEKLNGYPSRSGTAQREGGRLLPGEYNGRGEPLGSNSAPDLTLTKPHDWSGFDGFFHPDKKKRREAGDDEESLDRAEMEAERDERAAMERDRARRSRDQERGRPSKRGRGRNERDELNRDLKRAYAGKTQSMDVPAPTGGGGATSEPQGAVPQPATEEPAAPHSADLQPAAPQASALISAALQPAAALGGARLVAGTQPATPQSATPQSALPPPGAPRAATPRETRTASYGSIEAKDPVTGRWLGSVQNAPRANWWRTGGEGSPTGPRLVRMKPIPEPLPYYDASGNWNAKNAAANLAQDRAFYAPGGWRADAPDSGAGITGAEPIKGSTDGSFVVSPPRSEVSAIAAKYGATKADRLSGGRVTFPGAKSIAVNDVTNGKRPALDPKYTANVQGSINGKPASPAAPSAAPPATAAPVVTAPTSQMPAGVTPQVAKNDIPSEASQYGPPAPPAAAAKPAAPASPESKIPPYSLWESPSTAYARQQARLPKPPPNTPVGPYFKTTGAWDAFKKGNLTAMNNWLTDNATKRREALDVVKRNAAGVLADSWAGSGANGSIAQKALRKYENGGAPPATPMKVTTGEVSPPPSPSPLVKPANLQPWQQLEPEPSFAKSWSQLGEPASGERDDANAGAPVGPGEEKKKKLPVY